MTLQFFLVLLLIAIAAFCTHGAAQSRTRRLNRERRRMRAERAREEWALTLSAVLAR